MKKYFSQIQVFTFLTIILFCTSCNGQVKKDLPKETVNETTIISDGHPKLKKSLTSLKDKSHNIHNLVQDKAGNIWFSTSADGVYKYDGKLFTQITTLSGKRSHTGGTIFEDRSGKIWLGTDDGIYFYDGIKPTKIEFPTTNGTLSTQFGVSSIMQDKSGKLWFATSMGVYVYDGKSFNYFKVTEDTKGCYAKIEKILEDNKGNIWFGGRCYDGVYRYDGKSVINIKLKELFQDGQRPHSWAFPHLQDKNGNIWFSNWGGVYRYDGKSFITFTKKDGLSGNMVFKIIEDKNGNIWFGGDGLTRYDGKSFTCFTEKDGLFNRSVWTILEDNSGNFWVGTRETGLYRFDGKIFTSYTEDKQIGSLFGDKLNPFGKQ
jgi:ligand-binding sensor domain-containing protein